MKTVLNKHKSRLRLAVYFNRAEDGTNFYLLPTVAYSRMKRFEPETVDGFILEGFRTVSLCWLWIQFTLYINDKH